MFWENDPSTDTPISADNLSRMEKYTLATAGSNGDFYVNFPNGANLAANDIVYILFPAATNGASNARLSVNNGSTYKNIKLSTIRIASEVASKRLSFVYDGTDFVPLETEFFPITYTPTVTAQTGTIISYTASASYIKIGRVVTVCFSVAIVNKGTGAGALILTTPIPIVTDGLGMTKETVAAGYSGACKAEQPIDKITAVKIDSTTLITTGHTHVGSVTYFA